jgi:hypothetical protein
MSTQPTPLPATPDGYADLRNAYQASLAGRTVIPGAIKNFLEELARLRSQSQASVVTELQAQLAAANAELAAVRAAVAASEPAA